MNNCRLNPLIPGLPLLNFYLSDSANVVEFSDDGSVTIDTGLWDVIPALHLEVHSITRQCVYSDTTQDGCVITPVDDKKHLTWNIPAAAFVDSGGTFLVTLLDINNRALRRYTVVNRQTL